MRNVGTDDNNEAGDKEMHDVIEVVDEAACEEDHDGHDQREDRDEADKSGILRFELLFYLSISISRVDFLCSCPVVRAAIWPMI